MVAFMLDRHDHAKPIMRSIARELLSSCVLRSIMTFFSPYTVNKASSNPPVTLRSLSKPYMHGPGITGSGWHETVVRSGLLLADHPVSAQGEGF